MHKDGSTSYVARLRQNFNSDPLGFRVVLPDGSLAVVCSVDESGEVTRYKVRGIHPNGKFRALNTISCWYTVSELRLHYYAASTCQVGL